MMISDLISIVAAGGGLRIDCRGKMVSDIVRIVAAAGNNRAFVVLENTTQMMVADKIKIAAAGKGFVFFNDKV